MKTKTVYMMITHVMKPIKGAASHKKSVAENPDNWETTENMIISDSVPRKKLYEASVVLDLLNAKVLKNRFELDDSQLFREYVDRYRTDIGEALREWALQSPENNARVREAMLLGKKDET